MATSVFLLGLLGGCVEAPRSQANPQAKVPEEPGIDRRDEGESPLDPADHDPTIEAALRYFMEELASDDYEARESATRALIRLAKAERIEAELGRARDPDVRWRLQEVLAWIRRRDPHVPPGVEYTPQGGVKKTITIINLPRPDK